MGKCEMSFVDFIFRVLLEVMKRLFVYGMCCGVWRQMTFAHSPMGTPQRYTRVLQGKGDGYPQDKNKGGVYLFGRRVRSE